MTDNVQLIADFPETEGYPAFRDAIYVPMDEYATMSETDKDTLRQERYDAWKAHLDNPPEPEPVVQVEGEPTPLQTLRDQAAQLLADLDAALAQEQAAQETPPQEA